MAENTVKIRYEGDQPTTVGHMVWYPGEVWNVDPQVMAQLQAEGVPVCLLQPIPVAELAEGEVEPEPEAKPKRKRKDITL